MAVCHWAVVLVDLCNDHDLVQQVVSQLYAILDGSLSLAPYIIQSLVYVRAECIILCRYSACGLHVNVADY